MSIKDVNKKLAAEKKSKFKEITQEKVGNNIIYEADVDYGVKYGSLTKYRKIVYDDMKGTLNKFPFQALKADFDKIKDIKKIDLEALVKNAQESLLSLFGDDSMLTKSANCADGKFLFYRSEVNLSAAAVPNSYANKPEARGLFLLDITAAMYLQKKSLAAALKAKDYEKEQITEMYSIGTTTVANTQTTRKIKKDVKITDSLFTQTSEKSGSSSKKESFLGQTIIYIFNCFDIDSFFPHPFRVGLAPILKGKFFPEAIIKGPTFFFVDLYGMNEKKFVGNWTYSKGQVSLSVNKKSPDIIVYGLRGKMYAFSSPDSATQFKDAKLQNRDYGVIDEEKKAKKRIEQNIRNKKNPGTNVGAVTKIGSGMEEEAKQPEATQGKLIQVPLEAKTKLVNAFRIGVAKGQVTKAVGDRVEELMNKPEGLTNGDVKELQAYGVTF